MISEFITSQDVCPPWLFVSSLGSATKAAWCDVACSGVWFRITVMCAIGSVGSRAQVAKKWDRPNLHATGQTRRQALNFLGEHKGCPCRFYFCALPSYMIWECAMNYLTNSHIRPPVDKQGSPKTAKYVFFRKDHSLKQRSQTCGACKKKAGPRTQNSEVPKVK